MGLEVYNYLTSTTESVETIFQTMKNKMTEALSRFSKEDQLKYWLYHFQKILEKKIKCEEDIDRYSENNSALIEREHTLDLLKDYLIKINNYLYSVKIEINVYKLLIKDFDSIVAEFDAEYKEQESIKGEGTKKSYTNESNNNSKHKVKQLFFGHYVGDKFSWDRDQQQFVNIILYLQHQKQIIGYDDVKLKSIIKKNFLFNGETIVKDNLKSQFSRTNNNYSKHEYYNIDKYLLDSLDYISEIILIYFPQKIVAQIDNN